MFDDVSSRGVRAVMKGAADGLRIGGKEVREFPLDPNDPGVAAKVREDLEQFKPDVIFLANHPATLFLKQISFDQLPCPTLVWLCDDPSIMGWESFGKDEIVLIADPSFEKGARERNAEKIIFLPVAAPDRLQSEFRQEYDIPVSYVGSVFVNHEARRNIPDEVGPYFAEIISRKVKEPWREFSDLMLDYPYQDGKVIQLTGQIAYFLYTEANRIYRNIYLTGLNPSELHLYGNNAWIDQICGTPIHLCFRGPLDPFTEYPHLIRSASINLNLRSLQIFVTPTQRDFLTPRLGGFLLSTQIHSNYYDWKIADPTGTFKLSEFPWSPSYQTPNELAEAVSRYLKDESARLEWIDHASRTIDTVHTFARRMDQLGAIIDSMPSSA